MEYLLNEQQKLVKNLARKIAEERILPVRADLDEREEFPWAIMKDLADSDLFRIFVPEEYEGLGGGCLDLCLIVEELSRVCSGVAVTYAASALGSFAIRQFGTEEQKKKYLPDIAAGKRLTAFALTEASAGTDATALKTTAEKVTGGYVLNGTKQFITNGGEAEIYTVIALTDKTKGPRGASAFLVDKGTPGFSFGKKEKKMGIRASATIELIFHDCFIPEVNIVGREGMGFIQTLHTLDWSRPGIGAQAVGVAQGALEAAVDYARQRVQFGHPIIALPAVQTILADMAIQVEAARALVYAVARTVDSGTKKITEESAMAKVFSSDVAMEVTTKAVQIFGGAGYMRDFPVEKMMRDAKITQIYEGANEMLRVTIAAELRKRRGRRE
ncbi:MAG: acyl-CoA dehydrogenase family protein [Dehalococcoidales bacterium]|nr:acyl-CoA dehydrogenase family protein [Dehalococcoidales bacterium]MDP6737775.1 acyl-CoA dehydrogenase family protein [Dehalococcoidales bacterium]